MRRRGRRGILPEGSAECTPRPKFTESWDISRDEDSNTHDIVEILVWEKQVESHIQRLSRSYSPSRA